MPKASVGSAASPSQVALNAVVQPACGVEPQRLVRGLEPAVARARAAAPIAPTPEHGEVRDAVGVDVQRVGAGDARRGRRSGAVDAREPRARRRSGSRCGTAPPGRSPPARYTSGRPSPSQSNTATPPPVKDVEAAVVGVGEAGRRGLVDEARRAERGGRRPGRARRRRAAAPSHGDDEATATPSAARDPARDRRRHGPDLGRDGTAARREAGRRRRRTVAAAVRCAGGEQRAR